MSNNFQNILAINASAGSGKTYQLTLRYLSILFAGGHPSKILAVTFTKKAAKEMRERIVSALEGLSSGKIKAGDGIYDELSLVCDEDLRAKAAKILKLFLSSNNKISTIDSFVHQILRKFCFYAGVRPDFELFTLDEEELKRRFLSESTDLDGLIGYLSAKNESVDRILGFFAALYEEESDLAVIKKHFADYDRGVFFASSQKFLRCAHDFYEYLNSQKPDKFPPKAFKSVYEFLKTSSFEGLLTQRESLASHRNYKPLSNDFSEKLFSELKGALIDFYRASHADTIAFLLSSFDDYKRAREGLNREKNGLGFDDIAKVVKELLESGRVESDFLYFRLDGEIEHILIDEFQDTSILQFRIVRPLLDEIISGIGSKEFKSFFMVGDPKQSIYRFRGASAGMFENVSGYIDKKAPGRFTQKYLDTNYRSQKECVSFVNDVFAPGYGEIFKEQKSDKNSNGFVEVIGVDGEEEGWQEKIFESVKNSISALADGGAKAADITVLGYTNDDIESIAGYLEEEGIKTQKDSSKTLNNDPDVAAVIDFLEYLRALQSAQNGDIYKLNFLCRTKFLESDFDALAVSLTKELKPASVVYKIIEYFSLKGANPAKMIELAVSYDDIGAFLDSKVLYTAKKISALSEGVTLMTVHKSKGLEFDYCILCDTLKSRDRKTLRPIIPIHKDFRLVSLEVTGGGANLMLDETAQAVKEEEELSARDLLNANYVAFTRAKNGLIVIKKNSGFSKLQALSLQEKKADKTNLTTKQESNNDKYGYIPAILNTDLGRQSDHLLKEEAEKGDLNAVRFGLALHGYVESMCGTDTDGSSSIYIKNKYGFSIKNAVSQIPPLMDGFAPMWDKDAKLYKEISICEKAEEKTLLHRIDMLAVFEGGAVVVDFKSSSKAKEGHKKQIQEYKRIVGNTLHTECKGYLALKQGDGISTQAV